MTPETKQIKQRIRSLAYYHENKDKIKQIYLDNRAKHLENMSVYNAKYYQNMKKQDIETENVVKPTRKRANKQIVAKFELQVQNNIIEYFDD